MKNLGTGLVAVGAVCAAMVLPAHAIDGDYNDDGAVNSADYTIWRNNFGTSNPLPNDPTPGDVGLDDYNTWVSNYGGTGTPQLPGPGGPNVLVTSLGTTPDGNLGFTIDIVKPTGENSMAVELAFFGPIVQTQFLGSDVDNDVTAMSLDGMEGYSQQEDTWYRALNWFDPNPGNNVVIGGITQGYQQYSDAVFISVGGGPFDQTQVSLLQLVLNPGSGGPSSETVTPEPLAAWIGIIAMGGVNYFTGGQIVIPEPASVALLGVGGVTLLLRKRDAR